MTHALPAGTTETETETLSPCLQVRATAEETMRTLDCERTDAALHLSKSRKEIASASGCPRVFSHSRHACVRATLSLSEAPNKRFAQTSSLKAPRLLAPRDGWGGESGGPTNHMATGPIGVDSGRSVSTCYVAESYHATGNRISSTTHRVLQSRLESGKNSDAEWLSRHMARESLASSSKTYNVYIHYVCSSKAVYCAFNLSNLNFVSSHGVVSNAILPPRKGWKTSHIEIKAD